MQASKERKADRALVILAILILLLSAGALYFDGWMWGGRVGGGDKVGMVTVRQGDVRVRFEGDLKWQKAIKGQDIMYNDAVFAGADSQAELKLGDGKLTVTQNSLVVIRREDTTNFLKLRFGSVLGQFAENEKVVIDTGNGKKLEFLAKSKVEVVLRKSGDKTELEVVKGDGLLTADGKTTKLESAKVEAEKGDVAVQPFPLQIVRPEKGVAYSNKPEKFFFVWRWFDFREPNKNDDYTLEFSKEANFQKLAAIKKVRGIFQAQMMASKSTHLFFRVRGPKGELSPTQEFDFVLTQAPIIVHPLAGQQWISEKGEALTIRFEFKASHPEKSIWWQVARDPEFSHVVANQNSLELQHVQNLDKGHYFLRARTDFGNSNYSDWSDPVHFSVLRRLNQPVLPTLAEKIIIPNEDYPKELYGARDNKISHYLAEKGLLRDYFKHLEDQQIDLKFYKPHDKQVKVAGQAWPTPELKPDQYTYRVQTNKQGGYATSPWSREHSLEIVMEAPRAMGEPQYKEVEGIKSARQEFTPLLFAASYDVQVSAEPGFKRSRNLRVNEPALEAPTLAGKPIFWRARGLDARGRPISDFSESYSIAPPKEDVPLTLADNKGVEREPDAETLYRKIEDLIDDTEVRSGFWAWVGSGVNYTDYKQAIPGRGSVSSENQAIGTKYFEGGYSKRGWGGLLTVTETPGKIVVNNAPVDKESYSWMTYSIEGQARTRTPVTLLGRPVILGMRVGLQHHQMPFLFLNGADTLEQKTMQQQTASLGGLAHWARNRWNYYWMMRYQYPFSSQANGSSAFQLKSLFAFDGSLGVAYNITTQLKAGAFWYGQWHQFNFTFSDGATSNAGSQSLFYSTMDLRLGFQF